MTLHPALGWVRSQVDRREHGHGAAVAGAVLWCVALGWVSFVRGGQVPILSIVDFGFHELGHLVASPLSDMANAAAGSVAQMAMPIGLAVYFAWIRTDRIATSVCLTWAATAARDVSVYIADAPHQELEIIGGEHDWAFLLAGHLDRAAPLAGMVRNLGGLFLVSAFALAVAVPFLPDRHHHRHHEHHPIPPQPAIGKVHFLD
jgi:hypothetical protein